MTSRHAENTATPLVSVVTPSLNAARFLEETISSVLSQDYPNIEYIVMDGGSTDGTLDILHRYSGRLRCESGPDRGQADAINRGFLLSRGEIFAYLCADDAYLPGAVGTTVRHMLADPGYAGVYGEGYLTDEQGHVLRPYPTLPFDRTLLERECFICQPAAFVWRDAFADAGMLDPGLHYALDHDLWIRIARRRPLRKLDEFLALARMHRQAKTLRDRRRVYRESMHVLKIHFGYIPFPTIYGYCCSLLDRRDGFFEPVPPSLAKYLLSVAYGSCRNGGGLRRFWKECWDEGVAALRRRTWPRHRFW